MLLLFAVLAVIAGLQAPGPGPEPTRLPPEDPAGQQMLEEPDPLGQWIPEQPVSRSRGDQAEEAGDSRSWWQRLFGAPEGLVTVTGHRWSRTVEVERLTPQVRETWHDQVPSGGEILEVQERVRDRERIQIGTEEKVRTYTERVQVGTEKVKVGTRDLGNGYFEDIYEERPVYENVERREVRSVPVYREEPIYDQWARYRIGRWERVRTEEAGGIDRAPGWPPMHLASGEREGRRRESYSVVFRDEEGRERIYTTDREDEWRSFEVGERYRAKLRGSDRVSAVVERVGAPAPSGRGSG